MEVIIGIEWGCSEPFRRLAVLQPLQRSTIRSFTSRDEVDFAIVGSSIANGRVEMEALSKKNAWDPLTYIAET